MKNIVLFIALFCQISIVAQNYKFGKVSKEEVEEKFYPLDSTADAAYLYKQRRTYYNYNNNSGFEIVTEVHIRIKLYTTEGFNYATFKLPYVNPEDGESENISSIKAYTYNLNEKGKVDDDKLSNKDIFDEKVNKFRHVKTITMPNLKEGSVIELEYTMTSPYTDYVDDLQFQYGIPVKKLLVTIETPEWLVFAKKNKGYYLITPQESSRNGSITFRNKVRTTTRQVGSGRGGTTMSTSYENTNQDLAYNISKFEGENIPPLKNNEPFVSNANNYRGAVTYELVGTRFPNSLPKNFSKSWDDVSKQIYKSSSFGEELEKSNYFKEDIKPLLANAKSDAEKLANIFQFVKANVKWNGYYSKYTDEGVRKAYKDKTGNAAEINLILTSMLREAGLNSNPVLVSSKGNGIPMFPTIKGFDYVISIVQFPDNSYVLLDATEPYSMPNILPERAINWNGRIVTKTGESAWVKLSPSKYASTENMALVKISDDLMVNGVIRSKYENSSALNFRKNKNHIKDEELKEKYEENNNLEVEDFKIVNQEDLNKAVIRNVKFVSEDLLERIGNKIYIEPSLFLTKRINPFKLDERKFPVDFVTAWKNENKITIQIPKGYAVESLPESLAIALPDNLGVFKYQVMQSGNKIKTISSLEFNASIIPPQYYSFLKDFYGKIVDKESEKIVLIKS
ncbi:DUF3857 domain-containing protein [Polaribacter litorisediminis]|uniref:DUF3857 domain-containing protein n=1 Tax=Polaribacter litorisediminis TaxID=1908341 RepID=UPI001CBDCB27|nr:DUF3857 domain-containing protein [Polaribacter litorisediminis]UAM98340.1 DUF3857 domain-containing protein [Polaribacter litorisediminis]